MNIEKWNKKFKEYLEKDKDFAESYEDEDLKNILKSKDNSGVDIERSIVHEAVREHNNELALLLLEHPEIDCNVCDENLCELLAMAIISNNSIVLSRLLEFKDLDVMLTVENTYMNALQFALMEEYCDSSIDTIKVMLEDNRLDINYVYNDGNTIMANLVEFKKDLVPFLLESSGYIIQEKDRLEWENRVNDEWCNEDDKEILNYALSYADKVKLLEKLDNNIGVVSKKKHKI